MSKIKTIGIPLALFLLALDQASKYVALAFYEQFGYYSYPIIGEYLKLTFAKNHGAAFSLAFSQNPQTNNYIFSTLTFFAVFFIIYLLSKSKKVLEILAFYFIIAGALGNFTDRILQGFVIDFIDCDFPNIILQRWPVFNLADSYICIAVSLFVIQTIKEKNEKKNN